MLQQEQQQEGSDGDVNDDDKDGEDYENDTTKNIATNGTMMEVNNNNNNSDDLYPTNSTGTTTTTAAAALIKTPLIADVTVDSTVKGALKSNGDSSQVGFEKDWWSLQQWKLLWRRFWQGPIFGPTTDSKHGLRGRRHQTNTQIKYG